MIKRFCMLCSLLFILSGCDDLTRLNQRAIVQAIGIDYIEELDLFKLSLLVFAPEGGGGPTSIDPSKSNSKIISSTGKSQSEALKNATLLQGKTLFLGDARLVLLGRSAAETKLRHIIGFFNTTPETQSDIAFATTNNTAESIIKLSLSQGLTPVDVFSNLLEKTSLHGKGISSKLLDVSQDYLSSTMSPVLPVIEIHRDDFFDQKKFNETLYSDIDPTKENDTLDETEKDENSTTSTLPEEIETLTKLKLTGSAVFLGGNLVGYLDEYESRGIALIRNEVTRTIYQAKTDCIESGTLRLYDPHAEINLVKDSDPLTLSVDIKSNATLLGVTAPHGSKRICDTDIIELTEAVERLIYKECHDVIYKVTRIYDSDVFHFGDTIWKQNPELWVQIKDNYSNVLQEIEVDVNVDVNINRIGLEYPYEF